MELASKQIVFKDRLTLIPIGDIHLGSRACDERRFDKLIQWILKREDTYVVGMGDYCDGVLRQDLKRFMGTSVKEDLRDMLDSMINEQTRMIVKKFNPLADEGRLLGMAEGNHEYSIKQHHSYDICKEVCSQLRTPFLGYSFFYRLTLKKANTATKRNLVIYGHHGHGAGRKVGASTNRLVDGITSYDADIHLMGHDHQKLGKRYIRLGVTSNGTPKLEHKPIILARTGSFLKTCVIGDTSYSEKAGYPPNDLGVVRIDIRLVGQDKKIDIHISE